MPESSIVALRELTTMRVGGLPERMLTVTTQRDLVDAVLAVWADGDDWLLLGGGSNTVASDEPFDGTVIRIATRGIEVLPDASRPGARAAARAGRGAVGRPRRLHGAARLVGHRGAQRHPRARPEPPRSRTSAPTARRWPARSSPSSSSTHDSGEVERVEAADLELGYRTSVIKQGRQGVVVSIELELHDTAHERDVLGEELGQPIAYAQLASTLGVQPGDRVSISQVRAAVLALRASKGMVLNADDNDTWSAGSFFTNPIVRESFARTLPADAPRWPMAADEPDVVEPLDRPALDPWEAAQQALAAPSRVGRAGSALREAVGGVAHRALRHPSRLRPARNAGGHLEQAHPRHHQPRGGDR